MNVDLYTDITCPWCYIASQRWNRVLADLEPGEKTALRYRPFQLNPHLSRTPMPLLDYYRMRGGEGFVAEHLQAQEHARREGLEIDMERALAVNTFDAHRMLWIVERDHGLTVAARVHDALTVAYFAEGANIADHDTLAAIAGRHGADAERVRAALATGEGAEEVRAEIESARALGIRAVPSSVIGSSLIEGAVPASTLTRFLHSTRD